MKTILVIVKVDTLFSYSSPKICYILYTFIFQIFPLMVLSVLMFLYLTSKLCLHL